MSDFGLRPKDRALLSQLCIQPLKNAGARVWVFGSRARGDHVTYSDIDVLYEIPWPLSSALLSQIQEDLEESRLPIKVDLVDIKNLAVSYREGVFKDRIEVFE